MEFEFVELSCIFQSFSLGFVVLQRNNDKKREKIVHEVAYFRYFSEVLLFLKFQQFFDFVQSFLNYVRAF
jgi:CRISPR/Cas system CMR-associated protein Cmr3 (group 5 of RAMP superfamily)